MTEQKQLTLAEYEALPEDDAYLDELSRGYLVREPAPGDAHGRLVALISYRLMQYVDAHPDCGRVYCEAGFILGEQPTTVRRPDIAFVRAERVPSGYSPGIFRGPPDLAIEVLSPPNRAGAILHKVSELLDGGTPVVWVVDPARQTLVVHDQSAVPQILASSDRIEGGDLLPGLSWDLTALFTSY